MAGERPKHGQRQSGHFQTSVADGKVSRLASTRLLDGRRDTLPSAATAIAHGWCHAVGLGIPEADGKVSRRTWTRLLDGRRDTLPSAATAIAHGWVSRIRLGDSIGRW